MKYRQSIILGVGLGVGIFFVSRFGSGKLSADILAGVANGDVVVTIKTDTISFVPKIDGQIQLMLSRDPSTTVIGSGNQGRETIILTGNKVIPYSGDADHISVSDSVLVTSTGTVPVSLTLQ